MLAKLVSGGIVLLLLVIALLVALYFLAIRPILDTTDNAIDQLNPLDALTQDIQGSLNDAGLGLGNLNLNGLSTQQARKLSNCIDSAGSGAAQIQACIQQFQ